MKETQEESMNKKNEVLKKLIIFSASFLVVIFFYLITRNFIEQGKRKEFTETQNNELLHYIEDVTYTDKEIQIKGWAFLTGFQASEQKIDLICRDIYTGEVVCCDSIEKYEREDINGYYLCETDYTECGFTAKIEDKVQRFTSGCYEILLRVNTHSKNNYGIIQSVDLTVSTSNYITDGQLTAYRPEEYETIEKTGTLIDEITNQGLLLFFRKTEGIYLYQYQNFLYWITNKDFAFTEGSRTGIQYHLQTTQVDKLPEHRLQNNLTFDNMGFCFEDNEIKDAAYKDYRVSKCKIPTEYSVKYITTGYYTGDRWVWVQAVHLDVEQIIHDIMGTEQKDLIA